MPFWTNLFNKIPNLMQQNLKIQSVFIFFKTPRELIALKTKLNDLHFFTGLVKYIYSVNCSSVHAALYDKYLPLLASWTPRAEDNWNRAPAAINNTYGIIDLRPSYHTYPNTFLSHIFPQFKIAYR